MQIFLSNKLHATHHYKLQFQLCHHEIFERQAVKKNLFFLQCNTRWLQGQA